MNGLRVTHVAILRRPDRSRSSILDPITRHAFQEPALTLLWP
jgi:hypothetical protein